MINLIVFIPMMLSTKLLQTLQILIFLPEYLPIIIFINYLINHLYIKSEDITMKKLTLKLKKLYTLNSRSILKFYKLNQIFSDQRELHLPKLQYLMKRF